MEEENMREKMISSRPSLVALLSSLISQLFLILLLLFPSSDPISFLDSFSSSTSQPFFFLLHHFLSTSDIAAALPVLPFPRKRKRKRTHRIPDDDDDSSSRPDSAIPKNPDSFKQFFRMNSSTFEWLCGLLEPLLECRDPVQSPINLPAEARLGIGLFRLASGSDYPEISRRFRVSELISRFCVKQLCRVLCTNYRFWVGFPSPDELDSASAEFEKQWGLPNCCGIIRCARFNIILPKRSNSIAEETSKEDTIAAQIVSDSSSRILNITAGFRGNKSEYVILKLSALYKDIEKGVLLNSRTIIVNEVAVPQYLIGGQEYPLLPWLQIPFVDPSEGSPERNFNNVLRIMYNNSMLKTIASLRNWGILNSPIDADFKAAVAYIGSCSILHNMLLTREDFSAFCGDEPNSSDSTFPDQGFSCSSQEQEDLSDKAAAAAAAVRNALVTAAREI